MKDKIMWVNEILDATRTGMLDWKKDGEGEINVFFSAVYKDEAISFQRIINMRKNYQSVTFGLMGKEKVIVTKSDDTYINSEKKEAFGLLNELSQLIDPNTTVPEIKVKLIDSSMSRILNIFNRPVL